MPDKHSEILANSEVKLHFSMTLTDGNEAISTFEEEPMIITMGDGTFTQGMEMALYGLKADDEQELTLTPDQAYGFADDQLVHELPLSDFGTDLIPQAGQVIAFNLPNGEETPGLIREVTKETATVDFNHPLAGHEVIFKVKILQIKQPNDEA